MSPRSVLAAAAAVVALVAGAPGPAGASVGVDGSFQAQLTAYDPADTLKLPGDTHLLLINAFVSGGEQRITLGITGFDCGPHDPAGWPPDPPCTGKDTLDVTATRPRVDVIADDTVRARGTTPAGELDVTMTGAVGDPFVRHDLRRTIGTRRETSVGVERSGPGTPAAATLAGVTLVQPQELRSWAVVQTLRTTADVATVPAVPVPHLDPPGTRAGDVVTRGTASVLWSRRLPSRGPRGTLDVEIGRIRWEQSAVPGDVEADVQRQRCRAGQRLRPPIGPLPPNPCAVIGARFGAFSHNSVADLRHGRLHVVLDLHAANHLPAARVDLTVLRRDQVGFLEVERNRAAADLPFRRVDRSGVRWTDPLVTGTIGGKAPNRLWDADVSAWRQLSTREPA